MNNMQFDERQLSIRGQVFFHGLIVAMALILLNAFLQDDGIVWAGYFHQNLLIFMTVVTVVSIESILRGVYFGQRRTPWVQNGLFGAIAVILTVFCLQDLAQGAVYIENGGLTKMGASLVFDIMFLLITLVGIIKTITDKRKNDES